MRVKYPIDNLENRKKAMLCNVYRIQLNNLQELGYMLKHGDFSQGKMKEILERHDRNGVNFYFHVNYFCDFPCDIGVISLYKEQREYILIALDFVISYLPIEYTKEIIFSDIEFFKGTELGEDMIVTRNIAVNYIEENKEEFPEIYLELKLG